MLCSVGLLTSSYKCLHCRCLDLLCRNKISFLNIVPCKVTMGIWEIQVCFSGKMQDLRGSCLQLCHWVEDHWTSQVVPGLCTTELTHTTCRRKKKNRWPQQLSRYVHIIFSGGSSKIMTLNMCPGKGVLLPHQDSQTSMLTWSHTLLLQLSHHIICHVNFLSSTLKFGSFLYWSYPF